MGRSVLSHFLSLSTNPPRFSAPLSCSHIRTSYFKKRTGGIPSLQSPVHLPAGFRCLCTTSAPQTHSSDGPPSSVKKRVVSGVQPTGNIHLGNYLGAIKNWTSLQDTYETLFFIVDLHAITLPYDAQQLSKTTRNTAAIYLACGVDPSKASVFVQSHVRAHVELMWLLSSEARIGRLSRMIQFKEKSRKAVPEALIPPAGARVMSLTDGLSKMSKSAPSDQSRINLLDPKDVIANKIKRCKTDSFPGMEFDNPNRPECSNLLSIYQLVTGKTKEEVAQECIDMNWGTFKTNLADALIDHLHPIQARYNDITSDATYLDKVLSEGARKAANIADATLNNVYQAMGFLPR